MNIKPAPNFDKEVLAPLRSKQAAVAAQEAAQAAIKAQAEQQAAQAAQAPQIAPKQPVYSGSHEDWLRAAGIDPANWFFADYIIQHESGWNPNATNPGGGACGIGQQYPCGKWPHAWNDPIGGLIDMQSYVLGRYGSWANAYAYKLANGTY